MTPDLTNREFQAAAEAILQGTEPDSVVADILRAVPVPYDRV